MRRAPLLLLGALALAACGSGGEAAEPPTGGTVANVGVLPDPGAEPTTTAADPPTTESSPTTDADDVTTRPERTTTTSSADPPDPIHDPRIGPLADGDRLLVIGDSILAATDYANGGALCAELVPLGWHVGMDAVKGRYLDVGLRVTREQLAADDWDAAVVDLGSNYDGEPAVFADQLEQLITALAPRPVLLVTVTEFEPDRAEVNYIIRDATTRHDNVRVMEWAERSRDEALVGDDGLHLSDQGKAVYVAMVGAALGEAPGADVGSCLDLAPTPSSDDGHDAGGGDSGSDSSG